MKILNEIAVENHYDPGEHCDFCPLFYECEARQVMLKMSIKMLSQITDNNLAGEIPPERLMELYDCSNAIAQIIKDFKDLFRSEVTVRDGLENDTHTFTLNEVKKRGILFDKSLPELVELDIPNMQDLKDKLTLGSTVFKEFLKRNTPEGEKKGAFLTRVMDHLEQKGTLAISYHNRTTKKKRKD